MTLAECQENGWTHDEANLGECDSLLFVDFVADCELNDSSYFSHWGNKAYVLLNWRGGTSVELSELVLQDVSRLSPKVKDIYWMEVLTFSGSKELDSLPQEIWQSSFIQIDLDFLPAVKHLPKNEKTYCPRLKELTILDAMLLDTLDNGRALCKDLERIEIVGTAIRHIPEAEIIGYEKLEFLNLTSNKLMDLPKNLPVLDSLWWLDVSDNQITELPGNLGDIPELEMFGIADNLVDTIPLGFCENQRKFAMYESGNRICNPSDSLIRCLGWNLAQWSDTVYNQNCQ